MSEDLFKITLEVRDYECDLQGIVNNSVYQNYLEHARHLFLKAKNVDFAKLTAEGIHLVVIRAELDYKQSLKPGDRFTVSVAMEKVGRVRWAFVQEIRRQPDNTLMLSGRISGVGLNENGGPHVVPE
ncbi:MAG: acyl-CoA thioesterase, partial [Kiritimatiellia bacterium]